MLLQYRTRAAALWRRTHDALPMDSDVEVSRTVAGVPVPIRLRPHYLALVALGGAAGTLARFGLTTVAPSWDTLSLGTVAVNLLGPFLLGALLQSLAVGPETSMRRTLRLMVGTGFLGAFTSYAQLAVDTVNVFDNGQPLLAGAYALATVVTGVCAVWLGIFITSRRQLRRAMTHTTEVTP
jgi:CrcB protein